MFEKVCAILAEFSEVNAEDMTENSNILNDLGMNSLDTMDAVIRFEEEFDVEIPDREVWSFHTIKDIMLFLKMKSIQ